MNQVEIVLANTGERKMVEQGTQVAELAAEYTKKKTAEDGKAPWPILGALVNNKVEPLQYRIYNPKVIRLLDITDRQGFRMYRNALCMMLYTAVHDCYPKAVLSIDHSLQNGFYCRIESAVEGYELPDKMEVCRTVREHMIELQEQDIPFTAKTMLLSDAVELVRPRHMPKTTDLLEHLNQLYIEMNFLGDTVHKINGKLAPSTGCLTTWDFRQYEDGYMLQCADQEHPDKLSLFQETPKLFAIFREHHQWVDLLHTPTVSDYNRIVHDKGGQHLILLAEALHEKKYAEIADQVRQSGARMVLLAGPSSSGKTTSCRRLSVQLSVLGYDVNQMSLDDYFMGRERTPKLPNGEYDFEGVDALDIPLRLQERRAFLQRQDAEDGSAEHPGGGGHPRPEPQADGRHRRRTEVQGLRQRPDAAGNRRAEHHSRHGQPSGAPHSERQQLPRMERQGDPAPLARGGARRAETYLPLPGERQCDVQLGIALRAGRAEALRRALAEAGAGELRGVLDSQAAA